MNFTIRTTETIDEAVHSAILDPLVAHNERETGIKDHRPLAVLVSDADNNVIGGLWGRTAWGWLFVELLFVPESLRGRGLGTELMLRAETEALARGCHNAWLDTYDFQAPGFYERLGYSSFGELKDYPAGFSRYFMKKALGNVLPR